MLSDQFSHRDAEVLRYPEILWEVPRLTPALQAGNLGYRTTYKKNVDMHSNFRLQVVS